MVRSFENRFPCDGVIGEHVREREKYGAKHRTRLRLLGAPLSVLWCFSFCRLFESLTQKGLHLESPRRGDRIALILLLKSL